MKVLIVLSIILFSVCAVAQGAPTPDIPGSDIDGSGAIKAFVLALQSKDWGLAVAFGLMLIVLGIRMFIWSNVKKNILPFLAMGMGVALGVAAKLIDGAGNWVDVVLAGIYSGLAAGGAWGVWKALSEWIKKLFGKE